MEAARVSLSLHDVGTGILNYIIQIFLAPLTPRTPCPYPVTKATPVRHACTIGRTTVSPNLAVTIPSDNVLPTGSGNAIPQHKARE